jgi:hypothetical protein
VSSDLGATGYGFGNDDDDENDTATQYKQQQRDGGARTWNMKAMFVTELVSQVDRSGLNCLGSENFEPYGEPNNSDMSVTPVVHDVESASWSLLATNAFRPARLRLVYVTPPTVNEAPTATPGHFTVPAQLGTVTPHCGVFDFEREPNLSNPGGLFRICWTHHVLTS